MTENYKSRAKQSNVTEKFQHLELRNCSKKINFAGNSCVCVTYTLHFDLSEKPKRNKKKYIYSVEMNFNSHIEELEFVISIELLIESVYHTFANNTRCYDATQMCDA